MKMRVCWDAVSLRATLVLAECCVARYGGPEEESTEGCWNPGCRKVSADSTEAPQLRFAFGFGQGRSSWCCVEFWVRSVKCEAGEVGRRDVKPASPNFDTSKETEPSYSNLCAALREQFVAAKFLITVKPRLMRSARDGVVGRNPNCRVNNMSVIDDVLRCVESLTPKTCR